MDRFSSILFLCIYWVTSITVAFGMERPSEIEDGYFFGRSGDMILKPIQYQDPDISMVLLDQTNKILVNNNRNEEISIYNIADLIGRSLGVAPMNPTFVACDYIKSNFFNRPMANLLIEFDSIGDHVLTDPNIGINLRYLTALRHGEIDGLPIKVTRASYPANSMSLATSLISGQKPSQHGIIGKEWKAPDGSIVRGFSSAPSTWSKVANLPDLMYQTFHGKSLIVSLSGDEQNAKTNSVNPALMNAHPSWTNAYTAHFRPKNMDFVVASSGDNPGIRKAFEDLTANNLQLIFEKHQNSILDSFATETKYREGFVSLQYTSNDGSTQYVRYDLTLPQDMKLFAEIQGAYSLATALKSSDAKTLVQDDFPDFYSIAFTSVTGLTEKYGRHSVQVVGALYLLDKTVRIIHDQFSKLYPNHLLSEIVLLGSHPSSLSANNPDKRPLISILNRLLPSQNFFDSGLFPSLYIHGTDERPDGDYCEVLNLQLKEQNTGFEVFCLPSRPSVQVLGRAVLEQSIPVFAPAEIISVGDENGAVLEQSIPVFAPAELISVADENGGTSDENGAPTDDDVAKYQIVLWISLLMFFLTVYTVYSMAYMNFKKDTIIYSTFNPNWENREARR